MKEKHQSLLIMNKIIKNKEITHKTRWKIMITLL